MEIVLLAKKILDIKMLSAKELAQTTM